MFPYRLALLCEVPKARLPERYRPCYVGFDAGGSSSMTAAACYWPESLRPGITTRRFQRIPSLEDRRGVSDALMARIDQTNVGSWRASDLRGPGDSARQRSFLYE